MTRDIHNFVWGNMDWESAIDLLKRVLESDQWIDYLIMEMELYEYFVNRKKGIAQPPEFEMDNSNPQR